MARGIRASVRWIPSEENSSDKPSSLEILPSELPNISSSECGANFCDFDFDLVDRDVSDAFLNQATYGESCEVDYGNSLRHEGASSQSFEKK